MSEERHADHVGGEPRPRSRRLITIAGAAVAALAILGFWIASREPTYLPPSGEQIDILLELAGVFPDKYGIMWREHAVLRSTDMLSQQDPSLLRGALFMHNLTTGGTRTEGDMYIEVAYRFYGSDHEIDADTGTGTALGELAADEGQMTCVCAPQEARTDCTGVLGFGNYEFSLDVSYNRDQCSAGISPARVAEFRHSMQTADRLINFYLEPLRRKPRWL